MMAFAHCCGSVDLKKHHATKFATLRRITSPIFEKRLLICASWNGYWQRRLPGAPAPWHLNALCWIFSTSMARSSP